MTIGWVWTWPAFVAPGCLDGGHGNSSVPLAFSVLDDQVPDAYDPSLYCDYEGDAYGYT